MVKNPPELLPRCTLVALSLHGLWIDEDGGMNDRTIGLLMLGILMELNYLVLFDLTFLFVKKMMVFRPKVTFDTWKQSLLFHFFTLSFSYRGIFFKSTVKDLQSKSSVFYSSVFPFFLESESSLITGEIRCHPVILLGLF